MRVPRKPTSNTILKHPRVRSQHTPGGCVGFAKDKKQPKERSYLMYPHIQAVFDVIGSGTVTGSTRTEVKPIYTPQLDVGAHSQRTACQLARILLARKGSHILFVPYVNF